MILDCAKDSDQEKGGKQSLAYLRRSLGPRCDLCFLCCLLSRALWATIWIWAGLRRERNNWCVCGDRVEDSAVDWAVHASLCANVGVHGDNWLEWHCVLRWCWLCFVVATLDIWTFWWKEACWCARNAAARIVIHFPVHFELAEIMSSKLKLCESL